MDMKQAVKFTFDTRFDEGQPVAAPRGYAKARFTEEDIERVRAEAYATGFAAGQAEAAARADQDLGNSMRDFAQNAASLLAALDAESASVRGEAVQLAHIAARKLAPALIASRPETEIESVLRECLAHLNREPHIVLRVADNLIERLKATVDRMAHERGLVGRIILIGQNEIAEGDCVVEWADGGVVRSREEIEKEIAETVARYAETLSGRGADNRLAMPETLKQKAH